MANAIADIAAKATLDVGPFTRSTTRIENATTNSVTKMKREWDSLKRQLGQVHDATIGVSQAAGQIGVWAGVAAGRQILTSYLASLDRVIEREQALAEANNTTMSQMGRDARAVRTAWSGLGETIDDTVASMTSAAFFNPAWRTLLFGASVNAAATNAAENVNSQIVPVSPAEAAALRPEETGWGAMLAELENQFLPIINDVVSGFRDYLDNLREANNIVRNSRLPFEVLVDTVNDLAANPALNADDAAMAAGLAAERLLGQQQQDRNIGSLDAGSQEVARIIANSTQRDQDINQRLLQAAQEAREQRQRLIEQGRQILELQREGNDLVGEDMDRL